MNIQYIKDIFDKGINSGLQIIDNNKKLLYSIMANIGVLK